ncbi:MAG: PEP-CTERM sorting domain-containing protein [Crocosphaera sp.]
MKKFVTALAIITGTTASLLMGTKAALSASFNWSYTTEGGDVYSGMLDGDVQEDGNTINVTSVFMNRLQEADSSTIISLPPTPVITNSEGEIGSTGVVSLDGTTMDLGACADTGCLGGIFIGDFGLPIPIQFIASSDFGNASENFNVGNWDLSEKPTVPEPSATLALVGLGLFSLVKTFRKKY